MNESCHTHADKYQLLAMALMSFLHENDWENIFAGNANGDKMLNGDQMTCVFVFLLSTYIHIYKRSCQHILVFDACPTTRPGVFFVVAINIYTYIAVLL